jgi:hypothetical protein
MAKRSLAKVTGEADIEIQVQRIAIALCRTTLGVMPQGTSSRGRNAFCYCPRTQLLHLAKGSILPEHKSEF